MHYGNAPLVGEGDGKDYDTKRCPEDRIELVKSETGRYLCLSCPAEIQPHQNVCVCVCRSLGGHNLCHSSTHHITPGFSQENKRNLSVVMEIYSHFSSPPSVEPSRVRGEGCRNEMWAGWHGPMTAGSRCYWSAIRLGSPLLKKLQIVARHGSYFLVPTAFVLRICKNRLECTDINNSLVLHSELRLFLPRNSSSSILFHHIWFIFGFYLCNIAQL